MKRSIVVVAAALAASLAVGASAQTKTSPGAKPGNGTGVKVQGPGPVKAGPGKPGGPPSTKKVSGTTSGTRSKAPAPQGGNQ
jgi:uncharacterized membrane protein